MRGEGKQSLPGWRGNGSRPPLCWLKRSFLSHSGDKHPLSDGFREKGNDLHECGLKIEAPLFKLVGAVREPPLRPLE
jgi:hypothetical protein